MKKIVALIALSVLTLSVAPFVFAVDESPVTFGPQVDTIPKLMGLVNTIINWIFTALIVTAIIFILISAFGWLTSGGDPAKTEKARNQLLYAIIAIVIGALAKGLVLLVGNLLGVRINF